MVSKLELSGNWEDRRTLENTTNFSIFKSDEVYSENVPVNRYLDTRFQSG